MTDWLEPRSRRRWAWLRSAWLVPVPVLLLYGVYLFGFYGPGHDPRDAILLGRKFVTKSEASSVIKYDPSYRYPAGEIGYDGEFVYFIAVDPVNARNYTDAPSYRYTRIVYPMLARVLALGQAAIVPYTLLIINWLAIAAGTLIAALWLRRKKIWPWFAAVYGLYPGLFIAFTRDTTEPVAYALVALAMLILEYSGRWSLLGSAIAFAVAALTRETTIVFPLLLALGLLVAGPLRKTWSNALLLSGVALVPLLIYKAFLLFWLGSNGDPGLLLERVPFLGLLAVQHTGGWIEGVRTVVYPALICAGAALLAVVRRRMAVEPWLLLINVVLFVVLLHRSSYVDISASARVTVGVVLAAIFCLPLFTQLFRSRAWFWASSALWLSVVPFWIIIPELHWFIDVTRPLRHSL
jgi:hypothetical protein